MRSWFPNHCEKHILPSCKNINFFAAAIRIIRVKTMFSEEAPAQLPKLYGIPAILKSLVEQANQKGLDIAYALRTEREVFKDLSRKLEEKIANL